VCESETRVTAEYFWLRQDWEAAPEPPAMGNQAKLDEEQHSRQARNIPLLQGTFLPASLVSHSTPCPVTCPQWLCSRGPAWQLTLPLQVANKDESGVKEKGRKFNMFENQCYWVLK